MAEKDTSNRGFGSMDPEKQREIAREGGRASHEKGILMADIRWSRKTIAVPDTAVRTPKAREAVVPSSMLRLRRQSHKNADQSDDRNMENDRDSGHGGSHGQGTRGGSSEQHAEAGRQSHKNAGQSDDRDRNDSGKVVRRIARPINKSEVVHQSSTRKRAAKVTKIANC